MCLWRVLSCIVALLADLRGSTLLLANSLRIFAVSGFSVRSRVFPTHFRGHIMSLRSTNNTLAAGLDAGSSQSRPDDLPVLSADFPPAPAINDVQSSSIQAGVQDVPSPAFLASVVAAVKQALAAEQSSSVQASPSVSGAIGGVPASFASSLPLQASALAASGEGFPPVPASITGSAASMSGRPNFVVPSFVSTFSPPVSSVAPSPSSVATGLVPTLPPSLPTMPVLQQSCVLPPGFSPVPPKLVTQILSNKFVELSDLLSSNIEQSLSDSDPQLFFDGRLVFTSTPKKPKRRIEDVSGWLEAFSVYCFVLTTHFPNRSKDLLLYQMLILRTYRQFTGRVWLAYDRAFREHAAATNLTDWSAVNVPLFNFHAAGASVRGRDSAIVSSEPRGAASSNIVCRSWNRGHCVAPFSSCRFAHKCSSCFGQHRVGECSRDSSSKQSVESKRPPASESPPRSRSKSRRL